MDKEYQITMKKEVLTEFAASILAKYNNYIIENNISRSDVKNPVVSKIKDISNLMNDITPKYNTISELDLVEGILKNLDKYIEGMKKNAK